MTIQAQDQPRFCAKGWIGFVSSELIYLTREVIKLFLSTEAHAMATRWQIYQESVDQITPA